MNWFWKLLGIGVVAYCAVTLVNKVPSSVFDPLTPANNALVQSQVASTMADVGVKQSVVVVNNSEAVANYAQASKIQQEVRRQNEMDDGTAINVDARIITGKGITDAEQVGASIFSMFSCGLLLLGALSVVAVFGVLSKLTRTSVTRV